MSTVTGILLCTSVFTARPGLSVEWQPVTEADWAVAEGQDQAVPGAVVIFEKVAIDDENMFEDASYYSVYQRIRILSAEGRDWGEIIIPNLAAEQEISEIAGRTLHRDGDSFDLKKSHVYEKEVLIGEGVRVRQKAFWLPAITADCIVEYYIKYRLKESPHIWVIQKEIPMLYSECVWRVCRGRGLRGTDYRDFLSEGSPQYVVLYADEQVQVEKRPPIDDFEEIVFSVSDVPAFEPEPFSLPGIAVKWQMRRFYGQPGGAPSYWRDRSNAFEENLRAFTSINQRLLEVVADFPEMSSDMQRVETACDWLNENIRNVDLDKIASDAGANRCVDHVVTHGYGNSLEINTLLFAMLHQMGIDAKFAFTINRNDNLFVPDAKYWQFDRTLVAVPDAGAGYTFLKGGYDYLAPGQLDWYNEGVPALIIGDPDRQFFTVGVSDAEANQTSRDMSLRMSEDLHMTGTAVEECTGQRARSHRVNLRKVKDTEMSQYLSDYFSRSLGPLSADSFTLDGLEDYHLPVSITCNLDGYYLGRQTRSQLVMRASDFFSKQENPFTSDKRRYEIVLDYAEQLTETLTLALPEGWRVAVLPADTAFANAVGECGISYESNDGSLLIRRMFKVDKPMWEARAYDDVRDLFRARQAFSEIVVTVNKQ